MRAWLQHNGKEPFLQRLRAGRKFLKSDSVETANIVREFRRLALVNNNIRLINRPRRENARPAPGVVQKQRE